MDALILANDALEQGDAFEMVRIHEFANDAEAHDDEQTDQLYQEFAAAFEKITQDLSTAYGQPAATGNTHYDDHELIPLNGQFRYALWQVGEQVLYVTATHEDRGVPILLVLGTTSGEAS